MKNRTLFNHHGRTMRIVAAFLSLVFLIGISSAGDRDHRKHGNKKKRHSKQHQCSCNHCWFPGHGIDASFNFSVPSFPGFHVNVKPSRKPFRDAVWIEGHWDWARGQYFWVAGSWKKRPHKHSHWVDGFWKQRRFRWIWIPAHWS